MRSIKGHVTVQGLRDGARRPQVHPVLALGLVLPLLLNGCGDRPIAPRETSPAEARVLTHSDIANNAQNVFFQQGIRQLTNTALPNGQTERGRAKNVILFVGDGMGVSTVTASRIRAGELAGNVWSPDSRGLDGPESYSLAFEHLPFAGLIKTYNTDSQVPDSAGTMVAMASGVKTRRGVLGYDETVRYGDCTSGHPGNALMTSLELAEIAGLATGIVSTARVTHATPAANYAKAVSRQFEDDSALPPEGCEGVEDIASQLVSFTERMRGRGYEVDGPELVLGGGLRHFRPAEAGGRRRDGRDLIAEWQDQYRDAGGVFLEAAGGLSEVDPEQSGPVLGLFNDSHMHYELDRGVEEPSLSTMTAFAIDKLAQSSSGYFLQVEAGRIDHAHHAGNAAVALAETVEFSRAVQIALDKVDLAETLIIVTADHSHVMTIGGYVARGNPILGVARSVDKGEPILAADDRPFTTLTYANGGGFCDQGSQTNANATEGCLVHPGRADLSSVDTQAPGFHQEALVPLGHGRETHGGEDVPVYAGGPGASLLTGTLEQTHIFHVTDYALDLVAKAERAAAGP